MSRLGCKCGHIIRDHSDGLPYKASFLKDQQKEGFTDWMVRETQSYVVAAQTGSVKTWLLERGYNEEYINLQLSHGDIMHDHIYSKYLDLKRDLYECQNCGRLHVEISNDKFRAYFPDSGGRNEVFKAEQAPDI